MSESKDESPTAKVEQRLLSALAEAPSDATVDRLVEQARREAEADIHDWLKTSMKALLLRRVTETLEQDDFRGFFEQSARDSPAPADSTNHRAPTSADPPSADTGRTEAEAGQATPREGERSSPAVNGRSSSPPDSPTAGDEATMVTYAFGIVSATVSNLPTELEGVAAGHTVRLVPSGQLSAIVCSAPRAEFEKDAFEQNLQDRDWLAPRARLHNKVLREVNEVTTVVPLRFGTTLQSDDDLRGWMERHEAELRDALQRLEGREEWGVRLYRRYDKLIEHLRHKPNTHAAGAGASGQSPGKSYLQEKQRQDASREEAEKVSKATARRCRDELAGAAEQTTMLRLDSETPAQDQPQLILNTSHLVAQSQQKQFHALAESLAEEVEARGFSLEVTGPWPPFSFVELDLTESADA
jgi:hypothetical protein